MSMDDTAMDASIVVCTYNRAESLRDTLRALQALQADPGRRWEVIVVDNNSKDHTKAVVEEVQRGWPLLRYAFEGAQGLSHARNHGIGCARGAVILFTDDDVLPEPDWLETTLAGLARYGADACGGFIAPIIRRITPRAALLGTLAGVSIAFISMRPAMEMYITAIIGLPMMKLLALLRRFGVDLV